ncbi:SDR family oxidoreductase [Actinocorallia longicatena]|uniref:SDR family oxidoreductase n=1 Tax=Actinocorallia longicatena TaxID=111803 RepID=A0ABP6QK73_9ACTN
MSVLKGTSALVTGGGSGIGRACAARLAADGAEVTIIGRTESRLQNVAKEIGCRYFAADVTDEEQIAAAVAFAAEAAPLRSVVASAGGSTSIGPIRELDAAAWRETLELNATGTLLTFKHAAIAMTSGGGTSGAGTSGGGTGGALVAISSIASSNTHRWFGAYGPSKAAVDNLVALAADELGPHGVRVNGIRPGLVATELVAGITQEGPVLEDYLACMPISRVGRPEDIADAAAFLVGPGSTWITGTVLNVDGGHHLRRGPDYSSLFGEMFGAL